jgi:asparagine synthase (glutamine-hydrolysing)
MCGICGIVARSPGDRDLARSIGAMMESQRHRGPDASGSAIFTAVDAPRPIALGALRLAILDLSDAGRQPMRSADGKVLLVYNGEVYNYRKLRAGLEAKGHTFASHTDTEVVLRLYEEHGIAFLGKLEGMFALAVLDLRTSKLLLARDQIGIKPLYYSDGPKGFLFASEIKGILASGRTSREVDWQAVYDYFTYLYIPGSQTAFREIKQLPPAHLLELDLTNGSSHLECFWRVHRRPDLERMTYSEAKEMLREELSRAVLDQLDSDVPLGVFLSGGADSTVVAGLATRARREVRTFTVGFDDPAMSFYDERLSARAIADHLGTKHEELTIARIDPFELLDSARLFDQPFGNPTAHLMYLLSRRAREHITVALCGAGGDELFAGYPRYRAEMLAAGLRFVPLWAIGVLRGALGRLRDSHQSMHLRRIREFLDGYDRDAVQRFANWTYFLEDKRSGALLRTASGAAPATRWLRALMEDSELSDQGNRLLHVDSRSFLVDNLLEYTDRTSMAASLEVRVPLLNHHFVEAALNIPFSYKMHGLRTKAVFRDAFTEMFPETTAKLPKRGFNAPLALYMRELDSYFDTPAWLRDRFGDRIGATWRNGLLDQQVINTLRADHRSGRADNSYELFSIIVFDQWFGEHVTQDPI